MGNRVWKGEPSAGGRAGTIIALGIAALVVAGVWFGSDSYTHITLPTISSV